MVNIFGFVLLIIGIVVKICGFVLLILGIVVNSFRLVKFILGIEEYILFIEFEHFELFLYLSTLQV